MAGAKFGAVLFFFIGAYLASTGYEGNQYALGIDLGTTYSVIAVSRATR